MLVDPSLRETARQLGPHRMMLDEFITRAADVGRIDSTCFTDERRIVHVHGHCHQKALGVGRADAADVVTAGEFHGE